ncbi:MAG TPA: choice-of-anchor D domain-containing protein [Solirubrobacterales bacterium]|nr:choice-of-anchor D domain-containing protein [Solirubrobacterales bacterium]
MSALAPGATPFGGGTAAAAIYWGATMKGEVYGGSTYEGEAPKNPAVWERFEHDAGKKVTFVNTGQNWGQFDTSTMQKVIDGGAIPLVTMGITSGVTMQEVAEGKQDTQIRAWANAAKAFGYPFMFRPWREMNGAWYSWGRDPHFVEAWRHFHDVVVEEGATNVTWAWIVNTIWSDPGSDPKPYYPGDAYVDWVGMDAYNWGKNLIQPDIWLSPEQAIGPTLTVLEEITDKPVALTEVASSEYGGNKASWARDFLDSYLPSHPNIKAMIWFNWNILQGGLRYDWPIESSVTAEQAFRDSIQSSEYLSQRPPLTPLTKVPMPYWAGPAQPVGPGPGPTRLGDGVWEPAAELGSGGNDERGAELAVGPDGTTTAVWEHYDGAHWVIQERRVGAGGSSLGPVNQLSAANGDAFDARVAVDPNGTATVVWKRFNGSTFVIQERRIDSGGTPEASVHDLSLSGQYAGQPQVAARPDGGAVVVWERHNTSRDVAKIQSTIVRPDGTVAACCTDLTDATNNRNSFEPQVAVAPDNTAVVVWDRHNGSEQIVQTRKLGTNGTPGTTYELSAAGRNAIEPDLAIAPDGRTTVTWTRFDGSAWVVQAQRLDAAGAPQGSPLDFSPAGGAALQPHVVALPDSSASIVWKQLDGSTYSVKQRRWAQDGSAGSTNVLSAAGVDAHEPRVAAAPDGTQTVVWALGDGSGEVVQARRIGADGAPAAETVDLSDAGKDSGAPFVAAGGSSSVAVAWRRFDGVRDRLQVAGFGLPAVSLDPSGHDFGSREVGSGPSQSQAFTIGNPGTTSLQISSIALEGDGAGQFHLEDPSACASAVLAPGASCQVSVSFEPGATGSFQAQLRVNSDAFFGGDVATVEGEGVTPAAGGDTPTLPGGTTAVPVTGTGTGHGSPAAPDNEFRFGRVKYDRKHGTARLEVWVPGPGSLRPGGKGISSPPRKRVSARPLLRPRSVPGSGSVFLQVGVAGAAQKKLLKQGRVTVRVQVSYLPTGGSVRVKTRTLQLRFSARSPSRSGR